MLLLMILLRKTYTSAMPIRKSEVYSGLRLPVKRRTPSSNPSLPVSISRPSRSPEKGFTLSPNNKCINGLIFSPQNKTLLYWVWCSTIVRPRCTGPPATGWPLITFAYQKTRPRFLSQDTSCSGSRLLYPRVSPSTRVEGELLIFINVLFQSCDI